MHPASKLRQALNKIPLSSDIGPWVRAVKYHLLQGPPPEAGPETGPQPLWSGGSILRGARFTPQGEFGCIYLASDPLTALREVSATFEGIGALRTPPWTVFAVEGFLEHVLDVSDIVVQDRLGTSLSELTGDWLLSQEFYLEGKGPEPPTQLLAKVAYETGTIEAIRYRSSKNVRDGFGMAVFADRLTRNRASFLEVYDPHGLIHQRLP